MQEVRKKIIINSFPSFRACKKKDKLLTFSYLNVNAKEIEKRILKKKDKLVNKNYTIPLNRRKFKKESKKIEHTV